MLSLIRVNKVINPSASQWTQLQTLCGWVCTNPPSATASPTYYTPLFSARWRSPAIWAWNPSSGRTTPATTRAPSSRWGWTADGRTTQAISIVAVWISESCAYKLAHTAQQARGTHSTCSNVKSRAALWHCPPCIPTDLLLRQFYLQAVDLLLQILVFLLVGINLFQTFSVFPLPLVLQALYDPLLRARPHTHTHTNILRCEFTSFKGEIWKNHAVLALILLPATIATFFLQTRTRSAWLSKEFNIKNFIQAELNIKL